MVKIYTDEKYLQGDIIQDNDAFFDLYVAPKDINEVGRKFLKEIDGAEIVDEEFGMIKTRWGAIPLEKLSTGAKTALNLMYLQNRNDNKNVNITDCGANALDAVFELMDDYAGDTKILLWHAEVNTRQQRQFLINDSISASNGFELWTTLADIIIERNNLMDK